MKISGISLENFRGYFGKTDINFGNLTAFIGANDVGKSTILEALDIFFNDGQGNFKIDKQDLNVYAASQNADISISVRFSDLPEELVIDSTNKTNLLDEYLLNSNKQLEIIKRYHNGGKAKIFIRAFHPCNPECSNLINKTNKDLKLTLEKHGIQCANKTCDSVMRKAIWQHFSNNLMLRETEINITQNDSSKTIWSHLQNYLPLYFLFCADRRNSDTDSEVQDPLKVAVKEILSENKIKTILDGVALEVQKKLQTISTQTVAQLNNIDDKITKNLNPTIPLTNELKWTDVFKNVSITGENDIPINKRGSGVKRLILLSFFMGDVERRTQNTESKSVIYAIEEPETSQHETKQQKLINALCKLSSTNNTQVILTTHSPTIVKGLSFQDLRLIVNQDDKRVIKLIKKGCLNYPSYNEINYLAFGIVSEEYHNELYGQIENDKEMSNYNKDKEKFLYHRESYNKKTGVTTIKDEYNSKTKIIRDQIHHPENRYNNRFTYSDLKQSIESMRKFIQEYQNARTSKYPAQS